MVFRGNNCVFLTMVFRRNYNEGRWVVCSTLLVCPVFLAGGLTYYFGQPGTLLG